MNSYKHILVGLDLSTRDAEKVTAKALALAQSLSADFSLVHVIEPLAFAYAGDIPIDLTDTQIVMENHASETLKRLASALPIAPRQIRVAIGSTADEIHAIAEEIGADLILVGSHARHGLALVLGSTASSVLKHADCDVLAVRI